MIKTNGYYRSKKYSLEDFHAGYYSKEDVFAFYIFSDDNKFLRLQSKNSLISKKEIQEKLFNSNSRYFMKSKNVAILNLDPSRTYYKDSEFILKEHDILERGGWEYHFHPWPDSEGDSEIE